MANAVGNPQHIEDLKKQAEKLKQEIRVRKLIYKLFHKITNEMF